MNKQECVELEHKIWYDVTAQSQTKRYANKLAKFWKNKFRGPLKCDEFIIALDEVLNEEHL